METWAIRHLENIKYSQLLIFLIVLLCGCKNTVYFEKAEKKLIACKQDWVYADVNEQMFVRVLYFQQASIYDGYYPNLLIAVSSYGGDTLAFIDKSFKETLEPNMIIQVQKDNWTVEDKEFIKPMLSIPRAKQTVDLFCSVQLALYGKFYLLPSNFQVINR